MDKSKAILSVSHWTTVCQRLWWHGQMRKWPVTDNDWFQMQKQIESIGMGAFCIEIIKWDQRYNIP